MRSRTPAWGTRRIEGIKARMHFQDIVMGFWNVFERRTLNAEHTRSNKRVGTISGQYRREKAFDNRAAVGSKWRWQRTRASQAMAARGVGRPDINNASRRNQFGERSNCQCDRGAALHRSTKDNGPERRGETPGELCRSRGRRPIRIILHREQDCT